MLGHGERGKSRGRTDFSGLKAVVVGEAMLDVYLRGRVARLSPEGPFPVIDSPVRETALGGAANVAANLAGLGASVNLVSVVGDDGAGRELDELAGRAGISTQSILRDPGRRTLSKTRVVGEGRTLARIDEGSTDRPSLAAIRELQRVLQGALSNADVVIAADYRYGVVGEETIDLLRGERPLLVVDSKDLGRFAGVAPDVVTSNYGEVVSLLGVRAEQGPDRIGHLFAMSRRIQEKTGASLSAITVDGDGVVLIEEGEPPRHLPTKAGAADPCGGGDTFTAAFALLTASGSGPEEAGRIAQRAAAAVVQKAGTATCTPLEMWGPPGMCAEEEVVSAAGSAREAGQTIVFTNGCFDVLHAGHVASLQEAASQGDMLIVAVNDDAGVSRLKGPDRPLNSLEDRAAVLAGLSMVDFVVPFSEDTPGRLLNRIRPHVYCKGADYRDRWIPELELVRTWGGRVHYTRIVPDRSTTRTIERLSGAAKLKAVP